MQNKEKIAADMLLAHGYVITMDPGRNIFEDGAVAVKDGELVAVGRYRDVAEEVCASSVRDLKGALVHPGLIDAHEHFAWHLTRGWVPDYFDIKATCEIFENPYMQNVSMEEEYLGGLLACMEMVLNGTTTFGDTGSAFYLDSTAKAVEQTGIRGTVGELIGDIAGDRPKMLCKTKDECLERLAYQLERYTIKDNGRVWAHVGLLGIGGVSDELLVSAKKMADKYGAAFHMHQSCFKDEVNKYMEHTKGLRPIEYLNKLGILDFNTTLVHMIHLSPEEAELVSSTRTNVVHCPGASVRFGLGASVDGQIPEMLKQGANVALGTDAGNWSDALDMFQMAYLAATIHKEIRRATPVISVEAALEMATVNGARALGKEELIGSLEVGKRADIVIHSLEYPEKHPSFNPLNNLIFSSRSKSVDTVLVDGKPVVEHGRLLTLDAGSIYKEVDKAALSLANRIGYQYKYKWPVT